MNVNIKLRFKAKIEALLGEITNNNIAVAVSGGSDSLALAILFNDLMQNKQGKLFCITINHSLRPESENEAILVGEILKRHKIEHHIIPWLGQKPQNNIQESARLARYKLLTDYCLENKINYLATGHQQNDQAENFIIRAEHISGVYGLAGIPAATSFNNVNIIRPLLEFTKQELQDFLGENNIAWIEDPSNQNERFARVRARNFLSRYPSWVKKLNSISKNLARAKESIEYLVNKSLAETVKFQDDSTAIIDLDLFNHLPQEIRFRMLAQILQKISNEPKIARGERIELLLAKISTGKSFSAATLSKCLITRKKHQLMVCPEFK